MNTKEKGICVVEESKGALDDDDGPSKRFIELNDLATAKLTRSQISGMAFFEDNIKMISSVRRLKLKFKLKKEYATLLGELVEVKRKLKILDEVDGKEGLDKVKEREQQQNQNNQNNP